MTTKLDPKEIFVDSQNMHLTYKYYWSVPTIQMCRNMIRQHLFSNGIDFKGKSNQQKQLFSQQIMEDFWLPFCEDALDNALCYGFVVWRTRKVGDTVVPIVCLKDTYQLKMKETDGVIEYFVYNKDEKANEIIDGAYVYDEFGHRPEIDGSLMSIVNTLIPDIQYYFTMLNCQVQLEKKRVKPPILTQIHDRKGVGQTGENEGIDYDFYADADIAEAEEESKYKRNRKAVEALKNQQRLYDEFFEPNEIPDEIAAPTILDQMVPLPIGQTVSSYPIQQGRNDIPVILKSLQDTICGVLGVPKSMIMADTTHKADAVGTHQMFQTTIMWWKRQVSEMCQMIYNVINAKEIANKVTDKVSKRKERISGDVYMATRGMQSTITFPVTPFINNEELYKLYTQGVIDWKTYCTYISRNTSIPLDTIPPEPLKDKEKKQLLGVNTEPRISSIQRKGEKIERSESPLEKKEKENEKDNDKLKEEDDLDKKVDKAVGKPKTSEKTKKGEMSTTKIKPEDDKPKPKDDKPKPKDDKKKDDKPKPKDDKKKDDKPKPKDDKKKDDKPKPKDDKKKDDKPKDDKKRKKKQDDTKKNKKSKK